MQFNTIPISASSAQGLSFDTVVPKPGSTRHVAASAFYHCLGKVFMFTLIGSRHGRPVLGTKNLLHFKQPEPYGPISITIEK